MHILRRVLVAVFVGAIGLVAWQGRWEGHLTRGNHTWIVDLGRAPIWSPPPTPTYAIFQSDVEGSKGFPAEETPGLVFKRILRIDWMVIDLLLFLWPATVVSGLVYLALRGERRDFLLHLGLCIGIGLSLGVVGCVGLWLLFGGWGPPAPELFGSLGLIGGIVGGPLSFERK